MRNQSINNKPLLIKDESEELKNSLKIHGLKVTGQKKRKDLVARAFAVCQNGVQTVKSAVEVESDSIVGFSNT